MISGHATMDGTANYFKRKGLGDTVSKKSKYFYSSKIGLGNHLGDFTQEDSDAYVDAMRYALEHGINVLDTAINYRGMKSEKDTGKVIREIIEVNPQLLREELVVSTKAGLLFGDITEGLRPEVYLEQRLVPKGIDRNKFQELSDGPLHTLNVNFFQHAIEVSRSNLGLETIDIHYIHIPEISRCLLGEEEFYRQLMSLFSFYEDLVQKEVIRFYGMAFELMVLEEKNENWHISLKKVCEIANAVGGEAHHFRFLQLPLNLSHHSAITVKNQEIDTCNYTLVDAAKMLGIEVVTNMPFGMGECFRQWTIEQLLSYLLQNHNIQGSICGSKRVEHVREYIEFMKSNLVR